MLWGLFFRPRLERALLLVTATMIGFMVLAPHPLWIRWINLAKCVYGFGVGSLVYSSYLYLRENHPLALDQRRRIWALMELAAFSIVIAFVTAAAYLPIRVTAPLVFGAVVLVYAFDAGPISRLLAAPLPALLGVLSYSIYMVHPFLEYRIMKPFALAIGKVTGWQVFTEVLSPAGKTVQMFGRTAWQGDLLSVLMLALLVIISWGTFRFIEDPARRRVRARFGLSQLSLSKVADCHRSEGRRC